MGVRDLQSLKQSKVAKGLWHSSKLVVVEVPGERRIGIKRCSRVNVNGRALGGMRKSDLQFLNLSEVAKGRGHSDQLVFGEGPGESEEKGIRQCKKKGVPE